MPRRKKEEEALLSDKDRVPRGAANARERTRMRVLSRAFGRLKLTLPWVPPDTKLSKLDTLRLATSYIAHLKRILDQSGEEEDGREEEDGDDEKEAGERRRRRRVAPSTEAAATATSAMSGCADIGMHCWPYGHHRLYGVPTGGGSNSGFVQQRGAHKPNNGSTQEKEEEGEKERMEQDMKVSTSVGEEEEEEEDGEEEQQEEEQHGGFLMQDFCEAIMHNHHSHQPSAEDGRNADGSYFAFSSGEGGPPPQHLQLHPHPHHAPAVEHCTRQTV